MVGQTDFTGAKTDATTTAGKRNGGGGVMRGAKAGAAPARQVERLAAE